MRQTVHLLICKWEGGGGIRGKYDSIAIGFTNAGVTTAVRTGPRVSFLVLDGQAGLLTPLTFAWHCLNSLAAFTSVHTFFAMKGSDSEFENFTLPALKAFLRPVVRMCLATSSKLNNLFLML